MIMLDLSCIMSTCMRWEIVSMTLLFVDLNSCGLTMEQIEVVNLRNSFDSGLQVGCGYVQPATKSIHENEERTVVSDAEHVRPFSSTS